MFMISCRRLGVKNCLKYLLTLGGGRVPARLINGVSNALNYLEVARWLREKGFDVGKRVSGRYEVFDAIINRVNPRQVLYLEFGVYRGDSIRYWSSKLVNPACVIHGFDSFEGLPEAWPQAGAPKGHFSTRGALPQICDGRVKFFKGWFSDTLPHYQPPPSEEMVINLDADLYSSTKVVLDLLKPWIKVGAFLYFDEFQDRFNELRAFDEFLSETSWRFHLVAANTTLEHVAFQRLPD
ncbi:MAG: TylF/MycF/NovP-related O-methyltransferase [Candidatus Methanomethyliaceae archaeon]